MAHESHPGDDGGVPAGAVALVDGHVHLHDCFEMPRFLDTAAANFAAGARKLGLSAEPAGCLMFVESQGVDRFAQLAEGALPTGRWQLSATHEPVSLVARRQGGPPLALIAGRQIVCREGLEVLALGTRATFADGLPLEEVLERVTAQDALPVVPWGVGKWQGARGRLVAGLLERVRDRPLYLGDNGGRLRHMQRPPLFARAESSRVHVLAGSDPLPFPAQLSKVGGCGFVAELALDQEAPFAAIREYLDGLEASPKSFGQLESLSGFIRSQLAMQIQKRGRPRAR